MSLEATSQVEIAAFPGLGGHTDPNDIPLGAAREQTNASSNNPGELVCRGGYLEVTFES